MHAGLTTLERAFALARSGACTTIDEIRLVLKREMYESVDQHLSGASIKQELRVLIAAGRTARLAPEGNGA